MRSTKQHKKLPVPGIATFPDNGFYSDMIAKGLGLDMVPPVIFGTVYPAGTPTIDNAPRKHK